MEVEVDVEEVETEEEITSEFRFKQSKLNRMQNPLRDS